MPPRLIKTGNIDRRCPSNAESEAAGYLKAPGESLDSLSLEAFTRVTPMREGALCWYPFRHGAVMLETRGGMGELTGLLCKSGGTVVSAERGEFNAQTLLRRHGQYENLTVINGEFPESPGKYGLPEKYDYIVCLEPESPDSDYFRKLAKLLTPDGRLIIAAWNKYALRRWCGAKFSALEQSGAELEKGLNNAGFTMLKWYYPLPNHRFPKAIYSDNKLPGRFYNTTIGAYDLDDTGALLREDILLGDVIDGGAFPFMSSSYIIEAGKSEAVAVCTVEFATVTAYRKPERAFVTAVYADGTAVKTALHPKGIESLTKITANHAALASRGLETLKSRLEPPRLIMPAIGLETLWEHLQRFVARDNFDRAEFLRLFDKLRGEIIKSSPLLPPGSHGWDESFGSVQETAYPELVPANCFYDRARDAFIFFDQEHAIENCPYSVPLSRAILSLCYSPVLSAHKETANLLPELVVRYGLRDCWDELLKLEDNFLEGVLNRGATRALDRASETAMAEIEKNRRAHDELTAVRMLLKKYKRAGVYGLGARGRRFCAVLELCGAPAAFVADMNAANIKYAPAPLYADIAPAGEAADVIIVTQKKDAVRIAAGLKEKTRVPVITLDEILENPEF